MPKEVIRGAYRTMIDEDGKRVEETHLPQVEIRWMGLDQGGNCVQVVSRAVALDGSDLRDGSDVPSGTIPVTDGYFVDLDRQGLNDLIRAARRARDQSFGKDA